MDAGRVTGCLFAGHFVYVVSFASVIIVTRRGEAEEDV
jgi:hypothetical protein